MSDLNDLVSSSIRPLPVESLMPAHLPSLIPKRGRTRAITLKLLTLLIATLEWATTPLRVLVRVLFGRTRRAPMSMADEVNYIRPRVVRAVDGRDAPVLYTSNAELLAESVYTCVRCAAGHPPRLRVPQALLQREFPDYYLAPFHGQPNGYLSSGTAVMTDRMLEAQYGEALRDMRREVARALGSRLRHGVLLDLGAGSGNQLRILRTEHKLARLFGIDLSPYMVASAYAHQLEDLDDHVEMLEGTITKLPFDDASVRGITACFVLHELPEAETRAALKEACRVLEPGARLVILDRIPPRTLRQQMRLRVSTRVFYEPYLEAFLRLDLASYLQKHGLTEVERRTLHPDVGLHVFEKPRPLN
jgi:ubiquinone/menaquinone biosynthesis C-methylase UbiE